MKPPKSRKAELAHNAMGGEKSRAETAESAEFKMTELGPIPVDWEVKRLGEIWSSFKTGPFGSLLHAQDYVENGTPLINPMHIQDGKIEPSPDMTVDDATKQRLSAYKLSQDDIIIGRRGEMGRVALVGEKEIGWLCGTGCFFLHLDESCCPNYIALYLRTPASVAALEGEAVGTTLVNLNRKILGDLKLPLPPLAEQRRIARALSDVDELISALGKLIEKKRNIKTGAMQELLTGKTRLPGFGIPETQSLCASVLKKDTEFEDLDFNTETQRHEVTEFKMTELGPIPKDWEVKRLGDVAKIGNGKDYKHLPEGNVPVYGTGGLMTYVNACLYDGATVCIGRKGTIDEPQYHEGKIWTVDTLFYTYDFKGVDPKFLYYLFTRINWHSYNSATGVPSLTAVTILGIDISLPPLAEQKAIAAVLSDIDAEIAALEADRAKYESIKQGMMQELLMGKTRIRDFAARRKAQDATAGIGSDL